jgi:murein L,D-transpeptidase YafK
VSADRIVVEKGARRLTIYREGAPLKVYRVALGRDPLGPKQVEGDGRTPEGLYTIDWRKLDSSYHRALHVSYPNQQDVARARQRGESPGGSIMIHGLPNGLGWIGTAHRATDWTDGCIAVTDDEIEELWAAIPDGTPIEIRR